MDTFTFEIKENVFDLPLTWLTEEDIIASNAKWFLLLEDIDSMGTNDEMLMMTFNPFLKVKQTDRAPIYV